MPLLAVLFIGLKLAEIIHWSWLWVLAPIWGPFALALAFISVFGLIFLIFGWTPTRRRTPTRWDF